MPQRSPESVPILEGTALLVRRPSTPKWQVKYRIQNRWIRTSTKETDLEAAKKAGAEIVIDAVSREKYGQPVVTRKFKSVAEAVSNRFKNDFENDIGPKNNRDYFQCIDRWLIPYFGKYNIANIENVHIKAFYDYRQTKFIEDHGKPPAKQTINTHALALKHVFEQAVHEKLMIRLHVPETKLKGYAAKNNGDMPKASFTDAEYMKLHRFMEKWIHKAKKGKFTHMRHLIRDIALFVANSGVRPGTELNSIKWTNVKVVIGETSGEEVLSVFVHGKTIPHWVNCRDNARIALDRIWKRSDTLKDLTWDQLLKRNEPVFALPDGTIPYGWDKAFKRLLKSAKMYEDVNGGSRSLYSLRHYYITKEIYRNRVSTEEIAKNCGTSPQMITKHYFNHDHAKNADKLAGHFDKFTD